MVGKAPEPFLSKTLITHIFAPCATPTTPIELSLAAAIPATGVPCPLSSFPDDVPKTKVFWP